MVNVKRLPGVFFTHKVKFGIFALAAVAILYCLYHWGFVCTNHEIRDEIQKLVSLFSFFLWARNVTGHAMTLQYYLYDAKFTSFPVDHPLKITVGFVKSSTSRIKILHSCMQTLRLKL